VERLRSNCKEYTIPCDAHCNAASRATGLLFSACRQAELILLRPHTRFKTS